MNSAQVRVGPPGPRPSPRHGPRSCPRGWRRPWKGSLPGRPRVLRGEWGRAGPAGPGTGVARAWRWGWAGGVGELRFPGESLGRRGRGWINAHPVPRGPPGGSSEPGSEAGGRGAGSGERGNEWREAWVWATPGPRGLAGGGWGDGGILPARPPVCMDLNPDSPRVRLPVATGARSAESGQILHERLFQHGQPWVTSDCTEVVSWLRRRLPLFNLYICICIHVCI